MNETHAPELRSWVGSANEADTDFPIQNLPFGVFRRAGEERGRPGVAIGRMVLDLPAALSAGMISGAAADACDAETLNALMALGPAEWSQLRAQLSALLREDGEARPRGAAAERLLVPMEEVEMLLPARIGDYTDFYASVFHATNVGSMFRPDNPLLPNYKWVPIGYHGRASSVVVGGTPVQRPLGQRKPPEADAPTYEASRMLDYELEVGCFIGGGNPMGETIPIEEAERHLFGLCLLNDWSARDVQAWEYQPLGPFLAKSFASSVSPWIVTREALEPFRVPAWERDAGDPEPLPHLRSDGDRERGGFGLTLEVLLRTDAMRGRGEAPARISRGDFRSMYWTLAQMITHHASNGCNLRPGDLLGSGTVSGPEAESRGCLLERTWRGAEPITLPGGETRAFLQDGDEVILRGWCEREGHARIGFGECAGVVRPAAARG